MLAAAATLRPLASTRNVEPHTPQMNSRAQEVTKTQQAALTPGNTFETTAPPSSITKEGSISLFSKYSTILMATVPMMSIS